MIFHVRPNLPNFDITVVNTEAVRYTNNFVARIRVLSVNKPDFIGYRFVDENNPDQVWMEFGIEKMETYYWFSFDYLTENTAFGLKTQLLKIADSAKN